MTASVRSPSLTREIRRFLCQEQAEIKGDLKKELKQVYEVLTDMDVRQLLCGPPQLRSCVVFAIFFILRIFQQLLCRPHTNTGLHSSFPSAYNHTFRVSAASVSRRRT